MKIPHDIWRAKTNMCDACGCGQASKPKEKPKAKKK